MLILNQCSIVSTIPPVDGNPGNPPNSKFENVNYHLASQLGAFYLVDNSRKIEVQKMGTSKPRGMNWKIERVKNLAEEFYRIKSGNGNYLHIENGQLEATPLGAPGWHSAMWAFELIDENTMAYQIRNRWKSDQYIQMDLNGAFAGVQNRGSLAHRFSTLKSSDVPVKEEPPIVDPPVVDPPTDNPLLVKLDGDPLKNGHPNLQPDLPTQSTPNANGNGAGSGDAFIGQIKIFAGNFAPRGWAFCNGQVLPIAKNTALFSLLGTMYGGDGRTTFALPDLRGRAPVHTGKTLGGVSATYSQGKRYGLAKANPFKDEYQNKDDLKKLIEVSDGVTIPTLGVKSQPTLSVHYIIALGGVFPSRS